MKCFITKLPVSIEGHFLKFNALILKYGVNPAQASNLFIFTNKLDDDKDSYTIEGLDDTKLSLDGNSFSDSITVPYVNDWLNGNSNSSKFKFFVKTETSKEARFQITDYNGGLFWCSSGIWGEGTTALVENTVLLDRRAFVNTGIISGVATDTSVLKDMNISKATFVILKNNMSGKLSDIANININNTLIIDSDYIIGDLSELNGNYTNTELRVYHNITGTVSDIATKFHSLKKLELGVRYINTVEELVKAYRAAGRTIADGFSLRLTYTVTFNGTVIKAGTTNALSWNATTITLNGTSITA